MKEMNIEATIDNIPTVTAWVDEQLEALEEGALVRHAIFGECSVECQHSCSVPGGMDLRIKSDEGKDIWEDWIRNGYCEDEINDERYYVFQEDEPLREDGILEIL